MRVGYIVATHVAYQKSRAVLLASMAACGIEKERIAIASNGEDEHACRTEDGIVFCRQPGRFPCQFAPVVRYKLGAVMGITHWFYLNCVSRCGPWFRQLVEAGFRPEVDATLASGYWLGSAERDRANIDLAMYRDDFLMRIADFILSIKDMTYPDDMEGAVFQQAATKAEYPQIGDETLGPPSGRDIYGEGVLRQTRYFPGVDLYRYVKNWGQFNGHQPPGV